MKIKRIPEILDENLKTVEVQVNGTLRTYKTHLLLSHGDYVVVMTGNGYEVGFITVAHDSPNIIYDSNKTIDWIVNKVDVDGYEKLKSRDKKIRQRAASLLQKKLINDLRSEFKDLLPKDESLNLEDF